MGRPIGTKNNMRTEKEKIEILLEYQNTVISIRAIADKYDISPSSVRIWRDKYNNSGIEGLKSNTGKIGIKKGNYKRSELEQLKEALLRKEIELMRLKKGYMVKGVGAKKEYVSISDLNMK